jgi:antitoxin HigA-1
MAKSTHAKKTVADKSEPRMPPLHPGEFLREEYLKPLQISAYRLAQATGMPQTRIGDIIREKRGVSADTALKLAAAFATSPQFWMNMQAAYDLDCALDAADAHGGISVERLVA